MYTILADETVKRIATFYQSSFDKEKPPPDQSKGGFQHTNLVLPDFNTLLFCFIHLIAWLHIKSLVPGINISKGAITTV